MKAVVTITIDPISDNFGIAFLVKEVSKTISSQDGVNPFNQTREISHNGRVMGTWELRVEE